MSHVYRSTRTIALSTLVLTSVGGCTAETEQAESGPTMLFEEAETGSTSQALASSSISTINFKPRHNIQYYGGQDHRIRSVGNGRYVARATAGSNIALEINSTSARQKFSIFEVTLSGSLPAGTPSVSDNVCEPGSLTATTVKLTICQSFNIYDGCVNPTYTNVPGYKANCIADLVNQTPGVIDFPYDFAMKSTIIAAKLPGDTAYSALFANFTAPTNTNRPGTVFIKTTQLDRAQVFWNQEANDVEPTDGMGPSPDNNLSESWIVE